MSRTQKIFFRNAQVLVADDFEFNREVIAEMLRLMGIEPDLAEDGCDVIKKIKSKNYHLILMDIRMPKKDGYETSREIRSLSIPQPVIIALTASIFQQEQISCAEAGMNGYLSKPLEFPELEKVLTQYLGSYLVKPMIAPQ